MPFWWSIKLLVLHYFEQDFFTTKGTTFKEQSATWSMVLRKTLINLCMNLTDEMQIKISMKLLVSPSNLQFFTALSRWVLHCFLLVNYHLLYQFSHAHLLAILLSCTFHPPIHCFILLEKMIFSNSSQLYHWVFWHLYNSLFPHKSAGLTLLKSNSDDFTFFLVLT